MDFMNDSVMPASSRKRAARRLLAALLVAQCWLPSQLLAKNAEDEAPKHEVIETEVKAASTAETTAETTAAATDATDDADSAGQPDLPPPETMEDMAAYLAAVRTHIESNPGLAAAYLVFWSELKAGVDTGAKPGVDNDPYASLLTLAQQVSKSVDQQQRGDSVESLVTDVLQRTLSTLASQPDPTAGNQSRNQTSAPAAERLLANLDTVTKPRLNTEGRYEFSGALRTATAIGSSAEVWNLCKAIRACVKAHDQLRAVLVIARQDPTNTYLCQFLEETQAAWDKEPLTTGRTILLTRLLEDTRKQLAEGSNIPSVRESLESIVQLYSEDASVADLVSQAKAILEQIADPHAL